MTKVFLGFYLNRLGDEIESFNKIAQIRRRYRQRRMKSTMICNLSYKEQNKFQTLKNKSANLTTSWFNTTLSKSKMESCHQEQIKRSTLTNVRLLGTCWSWSCVLVSFLMEGRKKEKHNPPWCQARYLVQRLRCKASVKRLTWRCKGWRSEAYRFTRSKYSMP